MTGLTAFADDPPQYRLTDLGTISTDPGADSAAYGINSLGQIVGYSDYNTGPDRRKRAFLWLPEPALGLPAETLNNLGVLGGVGHQASIAYGINDTGEVVGKSGIASLDTGLAFLWLQDPVPAYLPADLVPGLNNLGTLEPSWGSSAARSISDLVNPLRIVGWTSWDEHCIRAGFLWLSSEPPASRMTALDPPDNAPGPDPWIFENTEANALALTPAGLRIAGAGLRCTTGHACPTVSVRGATFWAGEDPDLLDINEFGDSEAEARDVTEQGEFVGWAKDVYTIPLDCLERAAYWPSEVAAPTNLHEDLVDPVTGLPAPLPPEQRTMAEAIRSDGQQIVGWNTITEAALLWQPYDAVNWVVYDLNDLIDGAPALDLLEAHDVNDSEWIVGVGDADADEMVLLRHAFLLTPQRSCPEDITGSNPGEPDGVVDVLDLLAVLGAWGSCTPGQFCDYDVNGDFTIDVLDLLMILAAWGPCGRPPEPIPQTVLDCLEKFFDDPIALQACIEAVEG